MGLSGGNGRHISRALDSDSCWDAGRAVGVDEIGDRDGELVSPGMVLKAPRSRNLHAMLSLIAAATCSSGAAGSSCFRAAAISDAEAAGADVPAFVPFQLTSPQSDWDE